MKTQSGIVLAFLSLTLLSACQGNIPSSSISSGSSSAPEVLSPVAPLYHGDGYLVPEVSGHAIFKDASGRLIARYPSGLLATFDGATSAYLGGYSSMQSLGGDNQSIVFSKEDSCKVFVDFGHPVTLPYKALSGSHGLFVAVEVSSDNYGLVSLEDQKVAFQGYSALSVYGDRYRSIFYGKRDSTLYAIDPWGGESALPFNEIVSVYQDDFSRPVSFSVCPFALVKGDDSYQPYSVVNLAYPKAPASLFGDHYEFINADHSLLWLWTSSVSGAYLISLRDGTGFFVQPQAARNDPKQLYIGEDGRSLVQYYAEQSAYIWSGISSEYTGSKAYRVNLPSLSALKRVTASSLIYQEDGVYKICYFNAPKDPQVLGKEYYPFLDSSYVVGGDNGTLTFYGPQGQKLRRLSYQKASFFGESGALFVKTASALYAMDPYGEIVLSASANAVPFDGDHLFGNGYLSVFFDGATLQISDLLSTRPVSLTCPASAIALDGCGILCYKDAAKSAFSYVSEKSIRVWKTETVSFIEVLGEYGSTYAAPSRSLYQIIA